MELKMKLRLKNRKLNQTKLTDRFDPFDIPTRFQENVSYAIKKSK